MKHAAWVICWPDGEPYWPSLYKRRSVAISEYCDNWRALYKQGYRCKKVEVVEK